MSSQAGGCADQEAGPPPPSERVPSTTTSTAGDGQHRIADEPNPELRRELLAMMTEDQAVRTGIAPPGDDRTADELFAAWDSVDAANAARMREVIDEFGWPGRSLVGEDGAEAAWVLIQHADFHLDLQKQGLALLEAAVGADDASPGDLAYLRKALSLRVPRSKTRPMSMPVGRRRGWRRSRSTTRS